MKTIDKNKAAELLPEILDRLDDHCQWCADCDWDNDPVMQVRRIVEENQNKHKGVRNHG